MKFEMLKLRQKRIDIGKCSKDFQETPWQTATQYVHFQVANPNLQVCHMQLWLFQQESTK